LNLRICIAVVAVLCALGAEAAPAAPGYGVAEDALFRDDSGARAYADMAAIGMTQVRWTLQRGVDEQGVILRMQQALPLARANGVEPILSAFPPPATNGKTRVDPDDFCGWLAGVVELFDGQITKVIVGNEVNAAFFWKQDENGVRVGPGDYYRVLRTCYDRLKAVDPLIRVIGFGLSPRAVSAASSEPLTFLKAVADAYRKDTARSDPASPTARPIMDELAIHPYYNQSLAVAPPPDKAGFDDPNRFGLPNLGRVKQATVAAFKGTAQPSTSSGLKLMIDEWGYQVSTAGDSRYTGKETTKSVVTPALQAQYYADGISRILACDPAVDSVLIFHLIDERERGVEAGGGGWQSGLEDVSGRPRPSYSAVKNAIAVGCRASRTADGGLAPLEGPSSSAACAAVTKVAHGSVACVRSRPVIGRCDAGWGDADRQIANGCETDLLSDPRNCGAVGRPVPQVPHATEGCAGGKPAIVSCDPGWVDRDRSFTTGCEAPVAHRGL
jgi:hypothetical protein